MNRPIFFFFISVLIFTDLWGQRPYVQLISEEKKFGRAAISMMMEDHQGILWVGTYLGLLRFDGLETTVFRPEKGNPNSLSSEFVYYLFEDRKHNIWIATRNGLTRLDPSRKIFTRYKMDSADPGTLPNNRIFSLLPDTDSTFFLVCDHSELSSFNMHTGRVTRLNPKLQTPEGISSARDFWVTRAYRTPNDKIMVYTRRGMFEYDRGRNVLTGIQDTHTAYASVPDKEYQYGSRDGSIWFVAGDRLYKWIPDESLDEFQQPALREAISKGVLRIQDYDEAHMLVSTQEDYLIVHKQTGAHRSLRFREDQQELLPSVTQQKDQIVYSLETRDGIVVMGSARGDLLIINPLLQQFRFKNILKHDSRAPAQLFTSVGDCFDDFAHQKRYITVVQDSFFYVEDMTDGQVRPYVKHSPSSIESKWMLDNHGRLWLCNGPGLLEIDRDRHTTKAYVPETPAQNLFKMVEVSPGRMMVGSFMEGLYWFEPDHQIFRKIPEEKGWIRTQVFSMKTDPVHQVVWIGTVRNGLFRYDITRDTFIHFEYDSRHPHSIGGDWVRDIAIDSTGDVWFATDPIGLSRYDYRAHPDSAFINLSMEDGLPSNFIAGIGVDPKGFIWMTSLNGIARLDPTSFDITLFGSGDGLPSSRFSRANLVLTKDGQVLVGTQTGYLHFSTDTLITNRMPPKLVLRDFVVFDQSHMKLGDAGRIQPVRLSYKENYFTIQFSVINYTESELNTVRYIMEGLDEQWNTRTGIHQVSYTNVPPGDYTFRILAANNDGVWNEEETRFSIVIRPPFWQRTWFYILLAALTGGMISFMYQYKLKQSIKESRLVAEKETLKAEAEKQLAQLEMTALRAQMNPHFIFNCLNSINRFIIINDNDTASEYLTKFAKLIRQVLDNSRGEKTRLATEIETLRLYIEMESLRFADKFDYMIQVDPALQAEDFLIQPMLIQPYVENAIWHGLMHRKSKGKLYLTFTKKGNALQVDIEDNGVGRNMAKTIKDAQLVHKKSHGMKVTAERMSLLSKKMNVPVEAVVEDLFDEERKPTGTRVKLTLPLDIQPAAPEPLKDMAI